MKNAEISVDQLVPGGILVTDHVHHVLNDGACSRCGEPIPEDVVPLMLWFGQGGEDLLIYCPGCLGWPVNDELEDGDGV
ncbi:MAG TPA: hypothetical protein VHG92_02835 [Afifellaceae bacterium]|nr:hypothetical protein [Afifellaceae bacterium]